jgi:hypothetical protein
VKKRRPAVNAAKDEKIEKVHSAEDQQNQADLPGKRLDPAAIILDLAADPERQRYIPEVYQVKPDYQEMIHRIGYLFIPVKHLDQKNAAILMQGPRDPNG